MKVSIAKVGYATITDGDTADTYGTIKWLESEKAGGREYTADPRGELAEIYADGKTVITCDTNDGYDIKLTLIDIIDDISKDWLGRTVDKNGNVAEYGNVTQYPRFALILSEKTSDGAGKLSTYYNVQISKRPSKAGKTSEGKLEGQYSEYQLVARPREADTLVCYEQAGNTLPTAVPEPTSATV